MDVLRKFKVHEKAKSFFIKNYIHPLETVALVLHYRFAAMLFFGLFMAVVGSFYAANPMECIVQYDRSKPNYDLEDLCLTYPYTYRDYTNHHDTQGRVFAMHYKWVHWAFLFLVGAYHIPLFVRKYHENKDLNLYLTMLKNDDDPENRKQLVTDFVHNFIYTQKSLYKSQLLSCFWMIVIDFGSFAFFDVVLQNRFARLFPLDYPFQKWPQYMNDTMSLAFPQFVECTIGEDMMILSRREEKLGCRLPLMPMYEKIFLLLWFVFAILFLSALLTMVYYLFLGISPRAQKSMIYLVRETKSIKHCVDNLSVGDMMALNSLRGVVPSEVYRFALQEINKL